MRFSLRKHRGKHKPGDIQETMVPGSTTGSASPVQDYPKRNASRSMTDAAMASLLIFATLIVVIMVAWFVWTTNPSWKSALGIGLAGIVFALVVLRILRGPESKADSVEGERILEPVTPTHRARRIMADGEIMWRESHKHPIVLLPWWLSGAALTVALGALWLKGAPYVDSAWMLGMIILACRIIWWAHDRFCFTNLRVILLKGLLSTKAPFMPLSKVTDASLIIPWHSKLLAGLRIIRVRYGTFDFESAGQNQGVERIRWVPEAEIVNRQLVTMVLSPKQNDKPDES